MPFRPAPPSASARRCSGFTLMEMLVVVAIMGIVMTMALPAVYRQLNPDSMQKAVEDIMEACSHARAQAILNGATTELRIRPDQRMLEVGAAPRANRGSSFAPGLQRPPEREAPVGSGGKVSGFRARISDQLLIEMIDVNFFDFTEEELAQVRFYPNGTSDEFTIVLNNDKNEWRMIRLEVVTGLAEVYTDPLDPRVTHIINRQ